jgi:hypothetical protein
MSESSRSSVPLRKGRDGEGFLDLEVFRGTKHSPDTPALEIALLGETRQSVVVNYRVPPRPPHPLPDRLLPDLPPFPGIKG